MGQETTLAVEPALSDALDGDILDKVDVLSLFSVALLTPMTDSFHLNILHSLDQGQGVFWTTWYCLPGLCTGGKHFTNRGETEESQWRGRGY